MLFQRWEILYLFLLNVIEKEKDVEVGQTSLE